MSLVIDPNIEMAVVTGVRGVLLFFTTRSLGRRNAAEPRALRRKQFGFARSGVEKSVV